MVTSTVPAFRQALHDRLSADATISALGGGRLTVALGDPHPQRAEAALVAVGGIESRQIEWVASMTQATETYEVSVLVSVVDNVQNDRADLWERAYGLADAVTESLRTWTIAGCGGVVERAWVTGSSDDEAVDAAMREASVTLRVSVVARMVA